MAHPHAMNSVHIGCAFALVPHHALAAIGSNYYPATFPVRVSRLDVTAPVGFTAPIARLPRCLLLYIASAAMHSIELTIALLLQLLPRHPLRLQQWLCLLTAHARQV